MKKRIIVTGGAGFIGSHLVDRLIADGNRVTVIDDLSTGKRSNVHRNATLVHMDIRWPRLAGVFRRVRPDVVFHLAAQKNVRDSIENPLFDADVNIMGSLNVIEQSRKFGVKKFIFSSTGGALYGDGVTLPTPETVPPRPLSPYGVAKFAIEQYLAFYQQEFGMRSVSLRYANVFGPRQDPKGEAGVVAIFAERFLKGRPLIINGSGSQTRDYVYVDDVVRANITAMKHAVTGEVNIGTGIETSVNELTKVMAREYGSRMTITHGPAITGEVRRSALRCVKATKEFGWRPRASLREGIRKTFVWARNEYV